jgi:putative ABC transport system substrate-binding protein
MRRRDFVVLMGSVVACPPAARAQQGEPIRRIGALFPAPKDDPDYQPWMAAFLKAPQEQGWTEGRNLRLDSWAQVADLQHLRAISLAASN